MAHVRTPRRKSPGGERSQARSVWHMHVVVWIGVAAAIGLFAGIVDLGSTGIQNAAMIVMVGSFCFTAFHRERPWLWPLIIGGGVFVVWSAAWMIQFQPPYGYPQNVFLTLIALVPAATAAFFGALFRVSLTTFRGTRKSSSSLSV